MKKIISTPAAPKAIGPYNQAVLSGNTLYISGQIALVPQTGELVSPNIKEQTSQCLNNINAILQEAGFCKDDIVRAVIYLTDINDFVICNEIYGNFFEGSTPPARTTIAVSALPKNAKIEIEITASKD